MSANTVQRTAVVVGVEPQPRDGDYIVSVKRTVSSAASDSSDNPARSFAEQTSPFDTPASSYTASKAKSPKRPSTSETPDGFGASSYPRPDPVPRPTPRSEWIGTTHARRLLGVGSENTIKAWIGYGYLRGRRLPNGRTQVFLQDVRALHSRSLISTVSPPESL